MPSDGGGHDVLIYPEQILRIVFRLCERQAPIVFAIRRLNTIGGLVTQQYAVALAGARADWTNKVKNNYGLSWSVWNIASGKQETCTPGAGGTFACVVKAKPCNYVVP